MKRTPAAIAILSFMSAGCARSTPLAPAGLPPRPTRAPRPPQPDAREPIAPLLEAATLLLDAGLSVRGIPIDGTRTERRWLSISAGDAEDLPDVIATLATRLGPPTCSGSIYAQWDGPIRVQAYRPNAYMTAVIIESPPDPDAACAPTE